MATSSDHLLRLRLLWKGIGLGGSNFMIHSSEQDNKILAAILRVLANEICAEDDPVSKEKAKKFVDYIKADIDRRMP